MIKIKIILKIYFHLSSVYNVKRNHEFIIRMWGIKMSDLELNKNNQQRDAMDGGFAVVDRERIIEEEIRNITPWYKHFIHVFTAPGQMMEECLAVEPTKCTSVGVVGSILFMVIATLISCFNPTVKLQSYETLRASGIEETALGQMYSISMVSGVIISVITIFLGALLSTVLFQIAKAILKDKCKFSTIYKMVLLATMVTAGIQCIDALIACILGMSDNVFSIGILLGDEINATAWGSVLTSTITLQGIMGMIFMVIGYKVITHTSIQKGIIAVVIVEFISVFFTYLITSWSLSMQAALLG